MTDNTPHTGRFDDHPWCVIWDVYPDEPDPIRLSLGNPDGPDEWDATTVSLTVERAMLLKLAIERALGALEEKPAPR